MKVNIYRIDKSLPLPKYETNGAVGLDFYSRENTSIPAKGHALVPLNVIIDVPEGYVLHILPRSSTLRKTGLISGNSIGIIDQDYNGPADEIKFLAYNPTDNEIAVKRGDRIVQGIFTIAHKPILNEIQKVNKVSRGGFGSTDKPNLTM